MIKEHQESEFLLEFEVPRYEDISEELSSLTRERGPPKFIGPKRPVGRPRKNTEGELHTASPVRSRTRGRVRSESSGMDESDSQPEQPVRRGRGRPKKIRQQSDSSESDAAPNQQSQQVRRPRGRPKKVRSESSESASSVTVSNQMMGHAVVEEQDS